MIGGLASNTCVTLVRRHQGGEHALAVDRVDHVDPGRVGDDLVVLTEGRCDVHEPGAVLGRDVVGRQDLEGVGRSGR